MTRLEFSLSEPVIEAVAQGLRDRLAVSHPHVGRPHVEIYLKTCDVCVSWWRNQLCLGAIIGRAPLVHAVFRPDARGRWFGRDTFGQFGAWYFGRHDVMRVAEWTCHGERLMRFVGARKTGSCYELRRQDFDRSAVRRRIPEMEAAHVVAPEYLRTG
jgi:hypothetical protein